MKIPDFDTFLTVPAGDNQVLRSNVRFLVSPSPVLTCLWLEHAFAICMHQAFTLLMQ